MTLTCLSDVPLPDGSVIVFDLDDTLYPERDFVESGFRAVARQLQVETGIDVFDEMLGWFDAGERDPFGLAIELTQSQVTSREELIRLYRTHEPKLPQRSDLTSILRHLRATGHPLGVLTDGRSTTQRNKLRALGLEELFDAIVVSEEFGSEKPDERNYRFFEEQFRDRPAAYVGNDLRKDFVTPRRLGWITVCLLDPGNSIHPQDFENTPADFLPDYRIQSLAGRILCRR